MKNKTEKWKYVDISLPLSSRLDAWPKSIGVQLEQVKTLSAGDSCNASNLHIDLHAGTHIDAPLHHINDGLDISELDVHRCCGPVWVTEISGTDLIGSEELDRCNIPDMCRRLLIRTDSKRFWRQGYQSGFSEDYSAMNEDGARWLVDHGFVLVGIDYLSVQPFWTNPEVHTILFNAGIIVLEGVYLNEASLGWWELICLPLRLEGAEASPVRAVLRNMDPINVE